MMFEPRATIYFIIAGVGSNYRIMPDLFRDNRRLPDQSMDRYCFDTQIGCARFYSGTYKTHADLDRKREAAEALIPKVIVEIKGSLKWTFDEALEYLKEKRKFDQLKKEARKIKNEAPTEKRRQKRKPNLTIDEIYYATMAKTGRELPKPTKPKPAEPPEDRLYQETVARRMRQKEAIDSGAGFSTPQQSYFGGVITWSDPLITDVRLVRLVLGADRESREMTAEEESDYWYWKAIGK